MRLLPELREVSGLGAVPTEPAGEAARVELFQAVTTFLVRAAGRAPRLLILDDVHAADPGNLHLLQFASRHALVSESGLRPALRPELRDPGFS